MSGFILVLAAVIVLIGCYLYFDRRRAVQHDEIAPADLARRMLAKYEQMHALAERITSGITVRDIMTAPPDLFSEHDSVSKVRMLMQSLRVHHALVQNEQGHLSGIISDRDVSQRRGAQAWQIMTRDPISVGSNCSPMRAVGLMVSKRISCLPVVDGDEVCGLVTTTDLMLTLEALLKVVEELVREDREVVVS